MRKRCFLLLLTGALLISCTSKNHSASGDGPAQVDQADALSDGGRDLVEDASNDGGNDLTGDASKDGGIDLTGDASKDGGIDLTGDASKDSGNDLTGDASKDGGIDLTGDALKDSGIDLTGDILTDGVSDLLHDSGLDEEMDLPDDDLIADMSPDELTPFDMMLDAISPADIIPVADPTIVLLTPSPGLSTKPVVAGTAEGGNTVEIFAATTLQTLPCEGSSVATVTPAEFSTGISISVSADSTTAFSARVSYTIGKPKCTGEVIYVNHDNRYEKKTFSDEFTGWQAGEDPLCYSMPPQCIGEYLSGLFECPESHDGLDGLNKCNWTILHQPNWMSMDYGPNVNGLNGFLPKEVRVDPALDDGVLILSAKGYKWDGTLLPPKESPEGQALQSFFDQPQSTWLNAPDKYHCIWSQNTTNCPIISGAVYSKRFPSYFQSGTEYSKPRGYTQEYGRFEIRAKLPYGPGSFPAHWLLPQSGSWPERGEIDIMEADGIADHAYQTYHTGYCDGAPNPFLDDHTDCLALKSTGAHRHHLARGAQVKSLASDSDDFYQNYHVYGVDWSPGGLIFSIDGIMTLDLPVNSLSYGVLTDYQNRATGEAKPMNIPHRDFFLILNQSIHNDSFGPLNPLGYAEQKHYIDYVRIYSMCAAPVDFCTTDFYFDGRDGLCKPKVTSSLPQKSYPSPCKRKPLLTTQNTAFDPCMDPCPYGGYFDSCNCQVISVPQKREGAGDCSDCGLAWIHTFPDESSYLYYTYVIPNPTWNESQIACTDRLTYSITGQKEDVQIGHFDGAHCNISPALSPGPSYPDPDPYNEFYFVWPNPGQTIYYHPTCHHHGECGY